MNNFEKTFDEYVAISSKLRRQLTKYIKTSLRKHGGTINIKHDPLYIRYEDLGCPFKVSTEKCTEFKLSDTGQVYIKLPNGEDYPVDMLNLFELHTIALAIKNLL